MKKYLITVLVLLSMLMVQVGTVAAAPMASGTVSLVSVSHGFKGPICSGIVEDAYYFPYVCGL